MKDKITTEPISSLANNLWKFRTLVAAIKLNIFDLTEEKINILQASEKLKVNTDWIERLLNALVAMEFLEKEDGLYFNSPISSKFLVKSSPEYYWDFILMTEESDESWKDLDKIIEKGSPDDNRDRLAKKGFTKAMHNNA